MPYGITARFKFRLYYYYIIITLLILRGSVTPCAACEPGERRRVLNIEGLPHSNPLEAFDDMLTEFAADIVKATAPARDLLLPGKPLPADA